MKEAEVVAFWKMLRHKEQTELRAIIPKIETRSHHFSTQEELLNFIQKYEGGFNIYLGVNERKKNGTTAEDVICLTTIPIDIDCVKKPASDEDIIEAMNVASKIILDGEQQGLKKPFISFSGNGYQLFYCIPPIELDEKNFREIEAKVQTFERMLQQKYNTELVKLDNVGDLPRIMRIPSTFNIKSKTYSSIVNADFQEDEFLRQQILDLEIPKIKIAYGIVTEEIKNKLTSDPDIEPLMNGNLFGKQSRSEAEMYLVCKLIRVGLTKEEIFKVMSSCKLGKWQEASQQYRELTYHKAISVVTSSSFEIIQEVHKQIDAESRGATETTKRTNLRMRIVSLLALTGAKNRREATELMTHWILEHEVIKTTKQDEKPEMWIYKEGIYVPNGRTFVKETCRSIIGDSYTTSFVNEVITKIEADTYCDPTIFFKETRPEEIPVKNGILDVITGELLPFTPDKIFFAKIPITFDPNAVCPTIEKFFLEILKNPKEDLKIIEELFGYCLLKDHRIEKAFMLLGSGRNGKSRSIELLKKFVGADNCVSIPLQEIEKDSFAVSLFHGKLLNVVGDLSSHALEATGKFKELTGMDTITANRKFLNRISFLNYAKQVYSANALPRTYDFSPAFFNRWIILEFPYTFLSQKEIEMIKDTEELKQIKLADKEIIQRISTEEEMSGLLNRALDGLRRVLNSRDFSYSPSVAEVKNIWIRKSDSFHAFCMDYLTQEADAYVKKQELRKYYSDYCTKYKLAPLGDKAMKETLTREYGVTEDRITINPFPNQVQVHVWWGIKFKKK